MRFLSTAIGMLAVAAPLWGQMLNPAILAKPPAGTWPTYSGDYSSRRFSSLDKINENNISSLSLAWL